jgi:nitroimidazol reductase NimA-like FMN-containing flavoprotein (pyridoxamine 5'-phosphate oxidase superfamily)
VNWPRAERPHISDYGVPKTTKGLLSWDHVTARLERARHYWICTVSPDSRPHATPVDGLWLDDALYFGGGTKTRRYRNLIANSSVCVHLESAADVVIFHGVVRELRAPDPSLTKRLSEASKKKYGYGPKPDDYARGGTFVVRPHLVFAWKDFPKDATRWRLDSSDA